MIKMSALERLTKNQRKQISLSLPSGELTRSYYKSLNQLDEILRDYEDHDLCDHIAYRRYYRIFNITAQALCRVTKVLSLPGGPKFI